MKRALSLGLALSLLVAAPGCMTFQHTVGGGPTTGQKVEDTQWFAFWGLLPVNSMKKDSRTMAGGAVNYRVTTQYTALDWILSVVLSPVSICRQTITVER